VTIEDLLEELVGEIADETDEEEDFIRRSGNGSWVVDARLAVDELAREANIDLPDDDWDTVGGLVLGLAERIPEVGETFTHEGLTLAVLQMQGRRISQVRVTVDGASET
jgi:CBS domain containing-hemolysin-like protein